DQNGRTGSSVLEAIPGLVRLTTGAALRTTEWALGASVRVTTRAMRAATSGESSAELLRDIGKEIRSFARDVLGIEDLDDRVPDVVSQAVPGWARQDGDKNADKGPSLRDRGAELLRRSADVRYQEEAHPAYDRILGELAP